MSSDEPIKAFNKSSSKLKDIESNMSSNGSESISDLSVDSDGESDDSLGV